MSFSTMHSRRAAAERLLAGHAHDPAAAAGHIAEAERAEMRNHLLTARANERLAPIQ